MILKKIAIVACSNPIKSTENLDSLLKILSDLNIEVVQSKFLINNLDILNRDNLSMANELVSFFKTPSIDGIFDISGGDLCNTLLQFINFNEIKDCTTPFFGYSDLTVLLNAFYTKSNIKTYNYQLLNIVRDSTLKSLTMFKETFVLGMDTLFNLHLTPIANCSIKDIALNGNCSINAITVGGNIRCFLKLAGTPYMPSLKDKILFLESYSGDEFKMLTYLNQYLLLKDFKDIKAIILGNFTQMDEEHVNPSIEALTKHLISVPIFITKDLGHNPDAKCISIGSSYKL